MLNSVALLCITHTEAAIRAVLQIIVIIIILRQNIRRTALNFNSYSYFQNQSGYNSTSVGYSCYQAWNPDFLCIELAKVSVHPSLCQCAELPYGLTVISIVFGGK